MAIVVIAVNLALAFIKLFIGLRSNSLCILLDSVNGFFDTLTGIITAVALGLSLKERSEKFPYGYGRSEYVAGFAVSAAAVVMGGLFLFDSLNRITMPEPVWYGFKSTILLIVTVLIKLALAVTLWRFSKKLESGALRAIATDSFLDVGITTAAIISFVWSSRANFAVDAIFGIVISAVVLGVSVKMVVDNVRFLMGRGDFGKEKAKLIALCKEEASVKEIRKIVLHDYGYRALFGTIVLGFADVPEEEKDAAAARVKDAMKDAFGAELLIVKE